MQDEEQRRRPEAGVQGLKIPYPWPAASSSYYVVHPQSLLWIALVRPIEFFSTSGCFPFRDLCSTSRDRPRQPRGQDVWRWMCVVTNDSSHTTEYYEYDQLLPSPGISSFRCINFNNTTTAAEFGEPLSVLLAPDHVPRYDKLLGTSTSTGRRQYTVVPSLMVRVSSVASIGAQRCIGKTKATYSCTAPTLPSCRLSLRPRQLLQGRGMAARVTHALTGSVVGVRDMRCNRY